MQAGHADVGEPVGAKPWAPSVSRHSSATGRSAVPAVTTSDAWPAGSASAPGTAGSRRCWRGRAGLGDDGLRLVVVGPGEQHRAGAVGEQLADDAHALLGRLARAVDGLGQALAQRPVVIDEGVAEVGERAAGCRRADGVVGVDPPGGDVVEQRPQGRFVHRPCCQTPRPIRQRTIARAAVPCRACRSSPARRHLRTARVGFLGPFGTFTEQALRTQPDLADGRARRVPDRARRARRRRRRRGRLRRRADRELDRGHRQLHPGRAGLRPRPADHARDRARHRAVPGRRAGPAPRATSRSVLSIPVATAQCHRFLREQLPDGRGAGGQSARPRRPGSWPRAAADRARSAISPRVAAARYGLDVLAERHRRPPRQPDPLRRRRPRRHPGAAPVTTGRRSSCTSGPTSRAA